MKLLRLAFLLSIYAFLYIPILVLIIYSFNQASFSTEWQGFSLKWYKALLLNPDLLETTFHSLFLAFCSATVATILGTFLSILLTRHRFKGRKLFFALLYILLMSPDLVMGISFLLLFVALKIELGFLTLLLSHVTFCIPFVAVNVLSRLQGFDDHLLEAAHDLGATPSQAMGKVLLPLLLPAMISGWLLSFTLSMDDVIISFFVTGPGFEVLPLKIYSMVRIGVKPEVNALCTVLFVLTLLIVGLSRGLIREKV